MTPERVGGRRDAYQNSCQPREGLKFYRSHAKWSALRQDHGRLFSERMSMKYPLPSDELSVREAKPKLKKPDLYKVILLNDDYTPMEFVVDILERFFRKSRAEATRIMLHVHHNGVGVCGIYTRDIAETKVKQVMECAREHQHPLQCTMEPA